MRYRESQIKAWLSQYKVSGLSLKEFSKRKPFHYSSLSYWIKHKDKHQESFIEIKPTQYASSFIEIVKVDGVTIKIHQELSINEIKLLIGC